MSDQPTEQRQQTGAHDAGILTAPKKFDPKVLLRIVWSMLRRRWIPLGASFVLALLAGAFGSKPLTEKVWKASSLLLYTPPTIPEKVESISDSVSLANVSGFATSRPVLTRIKDDLGLAFPIALLAKSLKVETSRNSSTVYFSLNWGDKGEATQILERLMVVYPQYVAEVRQQLVQALLTEVEQQISGAKARQGAARERYRDFTRENNIVDFKQDMVLLQTKVLDLETKLSQAKRDEQTLGDQVKMLDQHINSIRREEEAESKANSEFEAAEESLADNRRRQNRLRELITEERRVLDVKSQIEVKRREYERAKLLAERSLIPNNQLEKARGELESLIAKITESESINQWKHELEELDKLVVPKNKVSKKGSPIIQQILFKKLETQLSIAQQQKAQLEIEQELSLTRTQIATFQRLRNELQMLEDDIEALGNERMEIESKGAILRQLFSLGAVEFSVVSPVSAGDYPVSSNRKNMFLGVVVVVLALAGTSIAAFDVLLCGIIPPDVQVELMGLPVISRQNLSDELDEDQAEEDPPPYPNVLRGFALHLRQCFPEFGSVLMFSELNPYEPLHAWLQNLATCLASRDERVLILDARTSNDGLGEFADLVHPDAMVDSVCESDDPDNGLMGLCDWLSLRCDKLEQIFLPTTIPAVDCVLPGRSSSVEELATIRMSELMEYARKRYSVTLLLGPDTLNKTEVLILAAHSDGIAMTFDGKLSLNLGLIDPIRSLIKAQAPVLGAVEL